MADRRRRDMTAPIDGPQVELATAVRRILGWAGDRPYVSAQQAGRRAGISHQAVANMTAGDLPMPETIRKFAEGMGEDPTPLLVAAGYISGPYSQPADLRRYEELDEDRSVDQDDADVYPRARFRARSEKPIYAGGEDQRALPDVFPLEVIIPKNVDLDVIGKPPLAWPSNEVVNVVKRSDGSTTISGSIQEDHFSEYADWIMLHGPDVVVKSPEVIRNAVEANWKTILKLWRPVEDFYDLSRFEVIEQIEDEEVRFRTEYIFKSYFTEQEDENEFVSDVGFWSDVIEAYIAAYNEKVYAVLAIDFRLYNLLMLIRETATKNAQIQSVLKSTGLKDSQIARFFRAYHVNGPSRAMPNSLLSVFVAIDECGEQARNLYGTITMWYTEHHLAPTMLDHFSNIPDNIPKEEKEMLEKMRDMLRSTAATSYTSSFSAAPIPPPAPANDARTEAERQRLERIRRDEADDDSPAAIEARYREGQKQAPKERGA